jgi:glycyl-tRNA synthetase beta chain
MPDYLLEIGTEELPAGQINEAQAKLEQLMGDSLKSHNLAFDSVKAMSTPRRLVVMVKNVQAKQETTTNRVKGPKVQQAFGADGKPTPQATGFAGKHGLTVEQLEREEVGGAEHLFANVTVVGKTAQAVFQEIAPGLVGQLPFARPMVWGSNTMKFSRPIRWIVSLLDDEVVEFQLEGLKSGRITQGHRILSPGDINLKNPSEYSDKLKNAKVIVDPAERRKAIEAGVLDRAKELGGDARQLGGSLLDEVVNLTEWPHPVVGEFGKEYLELPDTLIETIMVHHQRYFPIEKKTKNGDDNNLLPYFITISNNDRKEAQASIKQGNERVIKARLADGKFFYFDDQKTKLSDRKEALDQLTFQEGLGSYGEKVDRLIMLAGQIVDTLALDSNVKMCLERTAKLCKLDLVSNLVRELPELQGYVGSWYAKKEGEPPEIVTAISSHYAPRHTDDGIPKDSVGQLVSAIDKLDNVVGLFALGKKPSGSSDPYALRRQAQGLVDILVHGLSEKALSVSALVEKLLDEFEPKLKNSKRGFKREEIRAEVNDFIVQRLKARLLEGGRSREIIDAVLSIKDPLVDVSDVLKRLALIESLAKTEEGLALFRVGNRIGRILQGPAGDEVSESLFSEDAEKKLWAKFSKEVEEVIAKEKIADNEKALKLLAKVTPEIDGFFEKVMVNDEDEKKRANRRALLNRIYKHFAEVADFPKLQPIIPGGQG